jgi:hypothetical protein
MNNYETTPQPTAGSKGEAGYSVGQESNLPTAPEIPARATPTSPGSRSAPEVGGESAFGQNAAPETPSGVREYQWPTLNLPEKISVADIERDGQAICHIRRLDD